MSCNCTSTSSNSEGCDPLPAVDRAARSIARGTDGCPVELTGTGVVNQTPQTGVYISDGSSTYPLVLGAIQEGGDVNGLLGVRVTEINGIRSVVYQLTGSGADEGKILRFNGTSWELTAARESACFEEDSIPSTCCPTAGLAVWGDSGDTLCLQRFDLCNEDGRRNVTNPTFLVCEDGRLSPLQLCDLPVLEEGASYSSIVCTEDGPRVLQSQGISARQFIPFDVLGGGNPVVLPDSTRYNETDGTNVAGTIDFATATGIAVPAGATHVQLSWSIVGENNQNNSLFYRLYCPGSVSNQNQRLYMNVGDTSSDDDSSGCSCCAPLNAGTTSWLIVKSGATNDWQTSVFCRVEGYWVG